MISLVGWLKFARFLCFLLQDTYDEELLAAVAEVLPIMASALGPQTYGPVFQQLVFQPLMKRFQPGQPSGVRSTMIGQPLLLHAVQCAMPFLLKILTQFKQCACPLGPLSQVFLQ